MHSALFPTARWRRRTLGTGLAAVLLFGLVPQASADYIPCKGGHRRFDGSTIRWKVLAGLGTDYEKAAERATAAWELATDVEFVRDERKARVFFTLGQTAGPGHAAETELLPPKGCKITSADITFDTRATEDYGLDQIQAVAAHEIGHVLGLDDRHPPEGKPCEEDSIMLWAVPLFYNEDCQWMGPRSLDVREINRVY